MKPTGSAFDMFLLGLRLGGIYVRAGKWRRGLYLLIRPIDYWRTLELPISFEYLDPEPGEQILDVGSPKLISMYIAARAGADVHAMDIYDDGGLTDSTVFKNGTGADKLHVMIGDVRQLPFPDNSLDKVFSVSVLEHVFPPEGGDTAALKEIARVLRPGGRLVFTLPFVPRARVDYLDKDVYDRPRTSADEKVFYQRRYDAGTLAALLHTDSRLEVEKQEYICERFYHGSGRELWNVIGEGNKFKRLALAPLYPIFAAIFLKRVSEPASGAEYMAACVSMRKQA